MHKRIGILGGMSPESTAEYYQYITRTYTERFGDYGYPEVLIYSVNFQDYVDWPMQDRWDLVSQGLTEAAQALERAGADFILIATNTMHRVYDEVQAGVQVPMLNLLDTVADAICEQGLTTVGLLGTLYTMQGPLYPNALAQRGIQTLTPGAEEQAYVNQVIYNELVAGVIQEEARQGFLQVIAGLIDRGAQGIILGCTEIPMLIKDGDVPVPLFDTTRIHAEAALRLAVQGR